MKRVVCVLLAAVMSLSLCACGDLVINQYGVGADNAVSKAVDTITAMQSGTVPASNISSDATAAETAPAAAAEPAETTVNATVVVAAVSPVVITKSPYSESVPVGGSCVFIANAQNYTGVAWELLNWDGSVVYDLSAAPAVFGSAVYGLGTTYVTMCNVTSALNGWRIRAKFTNSGSEAYTDFAYIWTYVPSVPCRPVEPPCPRPCPYDPQPCPVDPCPCDPQPCPVDPCPCDPEPQPQCGCSCGGSGCGKCTNPFV